MPKNLFPHVKNFNYSVFVGFIFYSLWWVIVGFVLGGLYATHCI